jgi:hypothetical protein
MVSQDYNVNSERSQARQGALLALIRDKHGSRDIFRSYTVMPDGAKMGKIRRGGSLEISVAPGNHEVFLQIDWCRSPVIEFAAEGGETIKLNCRPGNSRPGLPGDDAGDSYIDLTRIY